MPSHTTDTDILIVGAGPVGLFLANECARRGLRYRIVESRATQSEHSKALAIFTRTLEIFDMAGIVDPFLAAANQVNSLAVTSHGKLLTRFAFEPESTPYPFVAMVPQNETEALLHRQLEHRGGKVEYESTFLSAEQHDDHVTATVEYDGKQQQITAAFLVGCDGAHSAVRHLLELPFDGAAYPYLFMLADIETAGPIDARELLLCPHEHGPLAIFPMNDRRCRIVATIPEAQGETPSLALTQRLLDERAAAGITGKSLYWSSYFHIHHRHVPRLREGRIFLAGDAAHIHSPFGGQGMNSGLHDAWNLIWKLDLALHGSGNETLLQSYTEERLPVIKEVIRITDLITRGMSTPSWLVQGVRDTVIPLLSHLKPFRHALVSELSEVGVSYPDSSIVKGDGERYFDDMLRGGEGIKSQFLLLLNQQLSSEVKQHFERLATSSADLLWLQYGDVEGVTLIRPDGYIAFKTKHVDDATAETVNTLLLRQTG